MVKITGVPWTLKVTYDLLLVIIPVSQRTGASTAGTIKILKARDLTVLVGGTGISLNTRKHLNTLSSIQR